jgi:hypothetical protein
MLDNRAPTGYDPLMVEQLTKPSLMAMLLEKLAYVRACDVTELSDELARSGDVVLDSQESAWAIAMVDKDTGRKTDPRKFTTETLTRLNRLTSFLAAEYVKGSPP